MLQCRASSFHGFMPCSAPSSICFTVIVLTDSTSSFKLLTAELHQLRAGMGSFNIQRLVCNVSVHIEWNRGTGEIQVQGSLLRVSADPGGSQDGSTSEKSWESSFRWSATDVPSISEWQGAAQWSCHTSPSSLPGASRAGQVPQDVRAAQTPLEPPAQEENTFLTSCDNACQAHTCYNHEQQRGKLHSGVNQTPREENAETPEGGRRKAGQEHQEPWWVQLTEVFSIIFSLGRRNPFLPVTPLLLPLTTEKRKIRWDNCMKVKAQQSTKSQAK